MTFIYDYINKKNIKILLLILLTLLMMVMPVLRAPEVGTDTQIYINMFLEGDNLFLLLEQGIEPLFSIIIYVLNYLGVNDYRVYLLFYSLIFCTVCLRAIVGLFGKITLPILALVTVSTVYFSHFNIIRQSLSIALFLLSTMYYLNNKNKQLIFSLVLGVLFHYSAIFNIVFFIFIGMYRRNKILSLLLLIIIFVILGNIQFVIFYLSSYFPFLRVSGYIGKVGEGASGFKFLIFNIFVFVFYLFIKFKFKLNSLYFYLVDCLFLFLLLFNIAILYLNIPIEGPGRVVYYYYIVFIFFYSMLFELTHSKQKIYTLILCFLFSFAYMVFLLSIGNMHGIFPYFMY